MWTVELPFKIGAIVYIPTCNAIGTWSTEKCVVKRYSVGAAPGGIEIMLQRAEGHSFRTITRAEAFVTEAEALTAARRLEREWKAK